MASAKPINQRIQDGPRAPDEIARTAVEQCIARRWQEFILKISQECDVPFLEALKHANNMQKYNQQQDKP